MKRSLQIQRVGWRGRIFFVTSVPIRNLCWGWHGLSPWSDQFGGKENKLNLAYSTLIIYILSSSISVGFFLLFFLFIIICWVLTSDIKKDYGLSLSSLYLLYTIWITFRCNGCHLLLWKLKDDKLMKTRKIQIIYERTHVNNAIKTTKMT